MKLKQFINNNYFQGYAYSYPHKSAYRVLVNPRTLTDIWSTENKQNLFLYLHIPFCEMRCGFCNLFTIANPDNTLENPYINQIEKQALATKKALGETHFSRLAIGGGTPSFLSLKDLEKMFAIITDIMKVDIKKANASIETSPKTISIEKLALFKKTGITRVSIGIQSFILEETKALGRPQTVEVAKNALEMIKKSGVPEMNIDLIYGMASQTNATFQYSLEQAMSYQPTEIFLYPLYVRPLTGLGVKDKSWNDHRLELYRFGVNFLEQNNYEQISMRIFRRKDATQLDIGPYDSPTAAMVSLGVGARSYTKDFHYSSEYAVGRKGVKEIIHSYNDKTDTQFKDINFGTNLSVDEQKRRFIIKSLLEGQYLDFQAYKNYFNTNVLEDFTQLNELYEMDLVSKGNNKILQLNKKGLELSDVIGPWLYSNEVTEEMRKYELK